MTSGSLRSAPSRSASICSPTMYGPSPSSSWSAFSPTHSTGLRPCCCAVLSFRRTTASFSEWRMRRSYWPTGTSWHRPFSIRADTSPVYAPPVSVWMFWAPRPTPLPVSSRATSVSHGNGGHTTISTDSTSGATCDSRLWISDIASSRVVFIFQLPTTSGLRTRPHLHRASTKPTRAVLDLLGGPAFDLGEVLDQLQSVARHAQELFLALGDAQIGRATARNPGEVAERADDLPVLLLADADFRQPLRSGEQGCYQLQVQLVVAHAAAVWIAVLERLEYELALIGMAGEIQRVTHDTFDKLVIIRPTDLGPRQGVHECLRSVRLDRAEHRCDLLGRHGPAAIVGVQAEQERVELIRDGPGPGGQPLQPFADLGIGFALRVEDLVVLQRPVRQVSQHGADCLLVERAQALAPLLVDLVGTDRVAFLQQKVAHVVVEALAQAGLHRRPDGRVPLLVLRRRQAHEEVVAEEVALGQGHALGVEAFEDAIRVVVGVQGDGHERQLRQDDADQVLESNTFVQLLGERFLEGSIRVADGRGRRLASGLDDRGEGGAVLVRGQHLDVVVL